MRPVLLGFKNAATFKAPATSSALGTPNAASPNFDEAQKLYGGASEANLKFVQKMIYNKVRVCPACSKPNGFTLGTCNSCGTDISNQALSHTLNVFAGFMLGIAKSTFPLTISIREESPSTLVLDDLLALSPIHVNVLPMKQFVPDWRYLLRSPAEGLAVAQDLKKSAVAAIAKDFLTQKEFLKSFTKVKVDDESDSNTHSFNPETDLSCGFNFPPSQYQLHLQCIFPVVLPYQYYLFQKGTHFTPGRFFPHEFVVDALKAAVEKPLPKELLQENTPMEEIVEYFKKNHDLDAEKYRLAFVDRFDKNFQKFEKWNRDDFEFVGNDDESGKLAVPSSSSENPAVDVMALVNKDKLALQSYGRPYTTEGKPQGKFYSYPPKEITEVDFWTEKQ